MLCKRESRHLYTLAMLCNNSEYPKAKLVEVRGIEAFLPSVTASSHSNLTKLCKCHTAADVSELAKLAPTPLAHNARLSTPRERFCCHEISMKYTQSTANRSQCMLRCNKKVPETKLSGDGASPWTAVWFSSLSDLLSLNAPLSGLHRRK